MTTKLPLILILAIAYILYGCISNSAGPIQSFSYTCDNCKCQDQKDYCESKGLLSSLSNSGAKEEVFIQPTTQIKCNYYCVTGEVLEKQKQNPNYQFIECTWMDEKNSSNNDFTFTKKFLPTWQVLDLQLSYKKDKNIEILSVEGEGDFVRLATLSSEWDDRIGGHQMKWTGIYNTKVNQKVQNGLIVFKYKKNGVEKSFTSVCKSNY
jgi:hypothetical protein